MWRLLILLDSVLSKPLICPPLVLLSILAAQHFSRLAVGESGDRYSGWAYVVLSLLSSRSCS